QRSLSTLSIAGEDFPQAIPFPKVRVPSITIQITGNFILLLLQPDKNSIRRLPYAMRNVRLILKSHRLLDGNDPIAVRCVDKNTEFYAFFSDVSQQHRIVALAIAVQITIARRQEKPVFPCELELEYIERIDVRAYLWLLLNLTFLHVHRIVLLSVGKIGHD